MTDSSVCPAATSWPPDGLGRPRGGFEAETATVPELLFLPGCDKLDCRSCHCRQVRLGLYEILAPIGAGGMAEVYRARDNRLNRYVAIKISSGRFSERFEREARAIASLNHPNICQLTTWVRITW